MTVTAEPEIDLEELGKALRAAMPAEEPRPTYPIPVLEAHSTLTEAIGAALDKLWPGDSKAATERRDRVRDAIYAELTDLVVYGVDLDARVPIGEPIVLGNAVIEVDAYGDAVSITTDGGMPVWDPR